MTKIFEICFKKQLAMALLVCTVIGGCSEKDFDPNNAEKSYAIAKEPYDHEYYEHAITRLGEFKTRFPYSRFAVEAELLIANSHYELGQYPEAAAAYSLFAKLHPSHPKVDFAIYREGLSFWEDAPKEIDREQEYTSQAIAAWQKLLERYPSSKYTKEVKKLSSQGQRRIAESIAFVGRFYCKLEIYHACAYRYQELAEKYPNFADLRREALKMAAMSFRKLAEQKNLDPKSDKNLYFKTMSSSELLQRANDLENLSLK